MFSSLTKYAHFKCIPAIFQHLSLTYCIPLVKDQSSFYEIRILTIYINIKAFIRVNRKQLNILKAFWNICNFILLLTKDDSILKVMLPGLVAYKPVAYKKKCIPSGDVEKFENLLSNVCEIWIFNNKKAHITNQALSNKFWSWSTNICQIEKQLKFNN